MASLRVTRPFVIAGVIAGTLALSIGIAPQAQANDRHVQMSIQIGVPGFYEPPVYYAPPPPPPVVYYPAPYYAYYHQHHHHHYDDDDGYRGHENGYRGDNGGAWRRGGGQVKPGRVNAEQIRYRERD